MLQANSKDLRKSPGGRAGLKKLSISVDITMISTVLEKKWEIVGAFFESFKSHFSFSFSKFVVNVFAFASGGCCFLDMSWSYWSSDDTSWMFREEECRMANQKNRRQTSGIFLSSDFLNSASRLFNFLNSSSCSCKENSPNFSQNCWWMMPVISLWCVPHSFL